MKALVFGVEAEVIEGPEGANQLTQNLARTPVRLMDVDDARPLHPDCGGDQAPAHRDLRSDSKQILLDFGKGDGDNAMSAFCSFSRRLWS